MYNPILFSHILLTNQIFHLLIIIFKLKLSLPIDPDVELLYSIIIIAFHLFHSHIFNRKNKLQCQVLKFYLINLNNYFLL